MAFTPIEDRDLIFVDTETTGLEPRVHEIIEVAIIRVNLKEGIRITYETKIKPQHIETAHPRALEVNGYTAEKWVEAPYLGEIAGALVPLLQNGMVVGHNVGFDLDMLNGNLKEIGVDARLSYHKLDTITLAYEHLVPLGLQSLSLDNIREFLGWSKEGAHTAMKDAEDAEKLFFLLERANWSRVRKIKSMIKAASKKRSQ